MPFYRCRTGWVITSEKRSIINVILSKNRDSGIENSEQTVTVDVSERGCFLFSVQDWEPGDTVWLTVMELSDQDAHKC